MLNNDIKNANQLFSFCKLLDSLISYDGGELDIQYKNKIYIEALEEIKDGRIKDLGEAEDILRKSFNSWNFYQEIKFFDKPYLWLTFNKDKYKLNEERAEKLNKISANNFSF